MAKSGARRLRSRGSALSTPVLCLGFAVASAPETAERAFARMQQTAKASETSEFRALFTDEALAFAARDRAAQKMRELAAAISGKTLKRGTAAFEWTLLSAGPDAPATVHHAQPLPSNDGADAADALCAKAR